MAKRLKVRQISVSRLEQRNDLLVSTFGRYVRVMGGNVPSRFNKRLRDAAEAG